MSKLTKKFATVSVAVATVASLTGASALLPVAGAATCYTWTRSLYVGLSGADVVALQDYLTGTGHFTFAGGSTGYFGSITQAAVSAWQAANGVSPTAGYFGPISQAKYATMCGDMAEEDEDEESADLEGGAGSISDADFVSSLNNEEVGENDEDVEVAGLEIEAEGSDIMLTAVTLDFDYADSGADTRLKDYAEEVSVWFEGEEVARVDSDEFDSDNAYTKTVALDSGAIVREDETGELTVAVTSVSPIDSANNGEKWNVQIEAVRFKDAQGASITENTQGDIDNTADDGTTTAAYEREFSFVTFATAVDLELQFQLDDEDVNDAHIIDIHASNTTEDQALLSFTIEVEGDSDVLLKDLPVNLDSVEATGNDPDDLISALTLWMDGEQVGSENLSTSDADDSDETVTFDDIDVELEAGEEYAFLVKADLRAVSAAGLDEGDTISAQISSTERDALDAEDETGEPVGNSDATGTAVGSAHALYDSAIRVELVSVDQVRSFEADASGETDAGEFTVKFTVEAFGADLYMDKSTEDDNGSNAAGQGVVYDFTASTTATPTVSAATLTGAAKSGDTGTDFKITEGAAAREFTLKVTLTGDTATDASYYMNLESINWGVSSTGANANYYTFNLEDFQTDPLYLQDL